MTEHRAAGKCATCSMDSIPSELKTIKIHDTLTEEIMAVLALFTGPITKDQYETLRKEVKWESDRAPGAMIHAASFDDAGHAHVADVWESAEQLDAFVRSRLIPAFQKLGLTPPAVEVHPTHNINVFSTADKYRL